MGSLKCVIGTYGAGGTGLLTDAGYMQTTFPYVGYSIFRGAKMGS